MGLVRRLIVFDLDGTLIDSRRDLAASANALITERGGSPLSEDAVAAMVGEGAAVLVRRALTAAGLQIDEASMPRFLELYDERLLHTTMPYPGIPEALAAIGAQAPLAVLTNKPLAPTRRLLEAFGLARLIADVLGGDGPWPRKPDPAGLRSLIKTHEAHPGGTVLVGDSLVDFDTARAAGVALCLTRYGFGYETFPRDRLTGREALVDTPAELPDAIARLWERE
jgi:phosphoglycolate phosphatase